MNEENVYNAAEIVRAYECAACGQYFESMDRLRQHEVDCKDDDKGDDFE